MRSLLVPWAVQAEPPKRSICSWKLQFYSLFFQHNLDSSNIKWTTATLTPTPPMNPPPHPYSSSSSFYFNVGGRLEVRRRCEGQGRWGVKGVPLPTWRFSGKQQGWEQETSPQNTSQTWRKLIFREMKCV